MKILELYQHHNNNNLYTIWCEHNNLIFAFLYDNKRNDISIRYGNIPTNIDGHEIKNILERDIKYGIDKYKKQRYILKTSYCKDYQNRNKIKIGNKVLITLKNDQRTDKRVYGIVGRLLTKSSNHPQGIKVQLTDGQVGRVQGIIN